MDKTLNVIKCALAVTVSLHCFFPNFFIHRKKFWEVSDPPTGLWTLRLSAKTDSAPLCI